jgi:hypothetical protein
MTNIRLTNNIHLTPLDPQHLTWEDAMKALQGVEKVLAHAIDAMEIRNVKQDAEAAMLAFNRLKDHVTEEEARAVYIRCEVRAAELDAAAVMHRCAQKLERIIQQTWVPASQMPLDSRIASQARELRATARGLGVPS